jgi:hypothetical protein
MDLMEKENELHEINEAIDKINRKIGIESDLANDSRKLGVLRQQVGGAHLYRAKSSFGMS